MRDRKTAEDVGGWVYPRDFPVPNMDFADAARWADGTLSTFAHKANDGVPTIFQRGLSFRDHLAAKAMVELITADGVSTEHVAAYLGLTVEDYNRNMHWPVWISRQAYKLADCMIREKRRTEKGEG